MADTKTPGRVVVALRRALSDVVVFTFRAQGYHWNVTGPDFAQYHQLFGEVYQDSADSIDALAENILKVGSYAPYKLDEFVDDSTVRDTERPPTASGMVTDLLTANDAVLASLFNLFKIASGANQQGIANLAAERIDAHHKWAWQLKATAGQFRDVLVDEFDKTVGN